MRSTKLLAAVAEARRGHEPTAWTDLTAMLRAEVPLSCDLREPSWSSEVRITGIADSLLRVPGRADTCAIELKLGKSLPVVDLAQIALYHLMLSRAQPQHGATALALLSFSPKLEERFVPAAELVDVERTLLDLIGRMAGVAPTTRSAPVQPAPPRAPARPQHEHSGHTASGAARSEADRLQRSERLTIFVGPVRIVDARREHGLLGGARRSGGGDGAPVRVARRGGGGQLGRVRRNVRPAQCRASSASATSITPF